MDYEAMATSAGVGSVSTGGIGLVRNAETPWKRTMPGDNLGSGSGAGSGGADGDLEDDESDGDDGEINYTGSGGGNSGFISRVKSLTLKGALKKFGPFGGILSAVLVGVGIFAGSNVAAPFAFLNNAMDQYNNLRTSMSKRSTYFTRFQLDNSRNKPITKRGAIFGTEKFKIGKSMQKKLSSNGIDYMEIDGTDGKKLKLLVYNDPDSGGRVPIVANEGDLARVPKGNTDIDVKGKTTYDAITLDKAMEFGDGFDFKKDLDVSTRTIKGHIAGWFDSVSEKFHARINSSRRKFQDTGDTPTEEEVKAAAKSEGLDADVPSSDSDSEEGVDEDGDGQTDVDEDGNEKTRSIDGDDSLNAKTDRLELKKKVLTRAKKLAGSGELICQVLKGLGAINAVIRGINIAKTLNYITGFLEAINRTQVGDGAGAMNYYMEKLTTPGDTVVAKYDDSTETYTDVPIREGTTAWGAAPMGQLFGGAELTQDDELVQRFNLDYTMKYAMESKGLWAFSDIANSLAHIGTTSKQAYWVCLGAQAISGAVSVAVDIVTLVLDIPTLGLAEVLKWVGKEALSAAASAAVSFAIGQVVAFVLPTIAQWLATDFIEHMVGEEPAYALLSGVNMYMGRGTQSSTGKWLSKSELVAQHRANQEVIAEEAEFERQTLSPFDITSRNTFFGSITHSLASVSNRLTSSPLGAMSSVLTGFGSSLRSFIPGVSAATDETKLMVSVNEECQSLSSLDSATGRAVGDAFCNPYFGQDYSTVSFDPADVFERLDARGSFKDDKENPSIDDKSDFAKYIVACEVRDTQLGQYDESIGSFTTGNGTLDNVIGTGLGAIPIVSGIKDIAESTNGAINARWANGEACSDSENADFAQYSIDQKIMEDEGMIEKSAVSAFLEDYYEKNPLDDSYEGIIARFSGLTKEKTEETLALIDYVQYVADYKPEKAVAMGEPVKHEPIMFEDSQIIAKRVPDAEVVRRIVYRDLRSIQTTA